MASQNAAEVIKHFYEPLQHFHHNSEVLGKRSKPSSQESNSQPIKKLAIVAAWAASNNLVNNNMPKVIDLGSKTVAAQEGSGEVQASNMGCSQNPTTNPQVLEDPSFQEFMNDAMNNNLWLPEENNQLAAIVPDHDHHQNYLDYYVETDGWLLP
ncbi:hypothetical protein ACH5RR_036308 [Cinchona calisaya]|uniref:Uncharacterized protein n=1 Tax=Cinchona calisaya TaxID=153742 RepID=A0ABD2Y7I0_9GENT